MAKPKTLKQPAEPQPVTRREVLVGGVFAPPLTDELLDRYEELAAEAGGAVGESMQALIRCCRTWWELPEPEGTVRVPHPSGRGTMVTLQSDHAEALDEHIPWKHEIEAMKVLFDGIDTDTSRKNSEQVQAWYIAMCNAVVAKHFPVKGTFELLAEAAKSALVWLKILSPDVQAEMRDRFKAVEACVQEIKTCHAMKECEAIPYPNLQSTELRDAAYHLLWHVVELDLGREPITTDKL